MQHLHVARTDICTGTLVGEKSFPPPNREGSLRVGWPVFRKPLIPLARIHARSRYTDRQRAIEPTKSALGRLVAVVACASCLAVFSAQAADISPPSDDSLGQTAAVTEQDATSGAVSAASQSARELGPVAVKAGPVLDISRDKLTERITARIEGATLAAVVARMKELLDVEFRFFHPDVAEDEITVAFEGEALELALAELLEGYSFSTYMDSVSGRRVVNIHAANTGAPAVGAEAVATYASARPLGRVEDEELMDLDDLQSLAPFKAELEALDEEARSPDSEFLDEHDIELLEQERRAVQAALDKARVTRAVGAVNSDVDASLKSSAIGELVGSSDPSATEALIAVAEDPTAPSDLRQVAVESLFNHAADFSFENPRALESLRYLAEDEDHAVREAALQSQAAIRRYLKRQGRTTGQANQ